MNPEIKTMERSVEIINWKVFSKQCGSKAIDASRNLRIEVHANGIKPVLLIDVEGTEWTYEFHLYSETPTSINYEFTNCIG